MFLFGFAALEFPPSLRAAARPDSPVTGCVCSELLIPVSDTELLEFLMFVQSFARSDLALFVFDLSTPGLLPSSHSRGRFESSLPMLTVASLGPPLLIFDNNPPGSLLSVHSTSRLDFVLSVPDVGHLDSSVSLRSFACLGLAFLLCDFASLGFSVFLQASTQPASLLLVCGKLQPGSSISAFHEGLLGSSSSLQSLSRADSPSSVLNSAEPDFSTSLQQHAWHGLLPFACGMSCSEFLALILDLLHSDFPLPPRALAKFGSSILVVDLTATGSLMLAQSSARGDLVLFMFDFVNFGSSLLTRLGLPSSYWSILVMWAHVEFILVMGREQELHGITIALNPLLNSMLRNSRS